MKVVATLVLHPHDTDLGELAVLLGNVGVSVHAVDFERLRDRGGLAALGAPPACAVIVIPEGIRRSPGSQTSRKWPRSSIRRCHAPRCSRRCAPPAESRRRAHTSAPRTKAESCSTSRARFRRNATLGSLQRLIVRKARELTGRRRRQLVRDRRARRRRSACASRSRRPARRTTAC